MKFLTAFRQGFTKEQFEKVEKAMEQKGASFTCIAHEALEYLTEYEPLEKQKQIYKTFNIDEKTMKKIISISKRTKTRKADIVRELIMEYVSRLEREHK